MKILNQDEIKAEVNIAKLLNDFEEEIEVHCQKEKEIQEAYEEHIKY